MGVKQMIGDALEGELGQPDLLRRVTEGITALARHAGKGLPVLPPEVEVHIKVGKGSVQVIEQFVQDPAFDREVEARILNELVRLRPDGLPVRRYVVEPGDRTSVEVREAPRRRYRLRIQGGDRDGVTVTGLELESLDQQQALVVERADGERLRPALAVTGRVPLAAGDRIEFTDGNKAVVTVFYEEA